MRTTTLAMHAVPVLLAIAMLAATPARAAQQADMAQMNAASNAWSKYAELSSQDKPASVDLLAASSLARFAFLRDAALYASPEQSRRLPISERLLVYAMRATQDPDKLSRLDGRGVAALCIEAGWAGVAAPDDEKDALPRLVYVTLVDPDTAVGETAPPTGASYNFGPTLSREHGAWKVESHSLVPDESLAITRQVQQSGMSEDDMVGFILGRLLDTDDVPGAFLRDRPLREDAAARTRLNESWPDYEQPYRVRVEAIRSKAEGGDNLAQMVIGSLLYSGALPRVVAQDRKEGLAWLEKSSDNGNRKAAELAMMAMAELGPQPGDAPPGAEWIARYVRYARQAADGGSARAMAEYASLLFNGAGELPRDCRQAAEWAQRAEDGGIDHARNDRVWYLATCPIPAQRDSTQAMQLAGFMIERADSLNASELDTVAAVLAANQRYPQAVDYQQRALAALDKDATATRTRMQQRLDTYRGNHDWVQDFDQYAQAPAR
jgi:TPR repeat protein